MELIMGKKRKIPCVDEIECPNCGTEVYIQSNDMARAIEEFIDDTNDEEIVSWIDDEDLKDEIEGISDVRDFMVEGYERLKLGTITKDEFLEHLFRLAKLDEFNSFDAKNVK